MHRSAPAIRRLALLGALLGALLAAAPTTAQAQDAPLSKGDVVRLLSGSTYSMAEVRTIVESNCLSFRPTERDVADFRDLGADDGVVSAVRACEAQRAGGEPSPAAPAPAAATPTFEVEPVSETVRAPVDSVALVTVLVRRGGQPYGGAEVVLLGSRDVAGGADRVGTSGADGRATIRVPTGRRVARYPMTIGVSGARVTGTTTLALETRPGPPTVLASPRSPLAYRGGSLEVELAVEDEFGNDVPGLTVAVAAVPDGSVVARGTTGSDGRVDLTLGAADLRGAERLVVSSEAGTIGELSLQADVRGVTMQFVAGTSQTGVPGDLFQAPLTVEVYDVAGDPAVGVTVAFLVRNGTLDADTLRTGPDGRASVRVTAGDDASRPVEIRARSGSAETVVSLPILSREGVVAEAIAQGQRRLGAGDAQGAAAAFRRATDLDPGNVNAWLGLGDALTEAGRPEDARYAYEQALALDPDNETADEALATPGLTRNVIGGELWGGQTLDSDRGFGVRYAELRVNPAISWLRLRANYDDGLNLRTPWLKRGADDLRGFTGAADLLWGSGRRLTTTVELGRREQPVSDLAENTFQLTQDIRFAGGGGLQLGGWVGRWFDRDDYVVFGEARFPLSSRVSVLPSVSYADDSGSNVLTEDGLTATGRAPETELRGGLKLRVESPDWGFEPAFAVGSVSSDLSEEYEGSLLDATALAWTRIGQVRLEGFVRYQAPPGTEAFWTVALAFGVDIRAR